MNDAVDPLLDLVNADAKARADALDPSRSFIVQAPAGSGKTELLIQRYLRLLTTVTEPEEVVAMTFTRKAAGEMRQRVLDALASATRPAPKSKHEKRTWTLARELLAHSERRKWALDRHSSRLRIQTIDAWCMGLTRNAPLASGIGLISGVADDTRAQFAEAARRLVFTQPMPASCARLLSHLDNQADRLISLIAGMLAQRDQWLPWLVQSRRQADLRTVVEQNWQSIVDAILRRANDAFPAHLRDEFLQLLRYGRANLIAADPSLEDRWPLAQGWPTPACADLAHWLRFSELVLTRAGELRKQVGNDSGFPAPSQATGREATDRKQAKDAMAALLDALRQSGDCADAWKQLRRHPAPAYTDAQWNVIEALLEALPLATAQLRVVFAESDLTDFTELALAALQVLGDESAPSDVLLAYDQRVRHLLVDEFQDTSLTQYALVSRLTAGWVDGDGRTLFAVGDPMQSVYRFRGAEVGLFLDARRSGIGDIGLQPLQLRVNFRSTPPLVEWVNRIFSAVLPDKEVPDEGLTPFVSAVAPERQLSLDWQAPVTLHGVLDELQQGQRVVELVETARRDRPDGDIAILVRTRNHLRGIIPALRDAGIAWQAIEIDPLASKQSIIDCMALTHALLEGADRLAWLAVLRAPWCGLSLADLTRFVAIDPAAVVSLLQRPDAWRALSDDGQARLQRCAPILLAGAERVAKGDIGRGVESTWLRLGGPATLHGDDGLDDVERYWQLLSKHAARPPFDWEAFVTAIDMLFGESPAPADGLPALQIMTMHKAKGLEFDTVIAPGLSQPPGGGDPPLLHWRADRGTDERAGRGERRLLFAPIQEQGADEDSQYKYLQRRIAAEERHELGRLLYVTATRARRALHWIAVVAPAPATPFAVDPFKPRAETSLGLLWDTLGGEWPRPALPATAPSSSASNASIPSQKLYRLRADWSPPPLLDACAVAVPLVDAADGTQPESPPFDWAQDTARAVGIVAHEFLRRIGVDGLDSWPAERIDRMRPSMHTALAEEGVPKDEIDDALERVRRGLVNALTSDRARWLFEPAHIDARSEFGLTAIDGDRPVKIILDRTFVDAAGTRWIVDYKTSVHRGADLEGFLDREVERHRPQLESYARALAQIDQRPIRVGVYWPLHDAWREWDPAPPQI